MALEYRIDPTKSVRIIVASRRSKRPHAAAATSANLHAPGNAMQCPFCPGSEKLTPPTLFALPNEHAWKTRAFANAFAFLAPRGRFKPAAPVSPAYGYHEVIVETNRHGALLQELPSQQLSFVLSTYKQRYAALEKKAGIKCVFLFKNHGPKGGASIDHEHAQITGLPFIPPILQSEIDFSRKAKHCPYCALAEDKKAIVAQNRFFSAVIPSYARFPDECWLIPKKHHRDFLSFTGEEDAAFMELLARMLSKLARASPDYNIAFHQSPAGTNLHFHAEIYPRENTWAGFELGTGVIVNPHDEKDARAALA